MTSDVFDEQKRSAFLMRAMENNAAAMTVLLGSLGERLGLFKTLADQGPATSTELAERASVNERYAREWLAGMHAAGYLERDAEGLCYTLPREHRPILTKEGHPFFLGSVHEQISALYPAFDSVLSAFRGGGGVAPKTYNEHFARGLERATRIWVERMLVQQWLPQIPGAQQKLEAGADVAELGCGTGLAQIKLAQTYPASRFVGYDLDPRCIEQAAANADAAGVSDRVTFEVRDATHGLPFAVDLATCFDVLHDVPAPAQVLRAIREALRPEGILLVGEWAVEDDPDEDTYPLAATLYGFSVGYCVPTTVAQNGAALGTLGLPEAGIRALAQEVGFTDVQPLASGHPILSLYVLTP